MQVVRRAHIRRTRSVLAAMAVPLLVAAGVSVIPAKATPAWSRGSVAAAHSTDRPWQTGVSSWRTTTLPAEQAPAFTVGTDGEVAALRTRNSRTFQRNYRMQTVFSTLPVNYRTPTGEWAPIDDSLVNLAGGDYRTVADDYTVTVPRVATGAVTATKDGVSVSSTLVEATGSPAQVAGATATYRDAFQGVTVTVQARPDVVEESFTLADASAPRSFASTVEVSGASLRAEADGAVSIVDASGAVVGLLPAPVLHDASGDLDTGTSTAAHYTLTASGPHSYTVTTTIDGGWLDDPARVFPVVLDPSTAFGTSADLGCYVSSPGAPDPVLCAGNTGTDNPLLYGYTSYDRHLYLNPGDLTAAVHPDAVVSSATLALTESSQSSTAGLPTGIYAPTAAWNSSITWSTQPATSAVLYDSVTVAPPGVGNVVNFQLAGLVGAWVSGALPNYGLEIRPNPDTPGNTLGFYGFANASSHPTLTVTWQQPVGQQKWVDAYDHRLSDRLDLHVDLADRNLVVNDLAEQLSGPGQSLVVRHTYNSLAAANAVTGAYGPGWLLNGGVDTGLLINRAAVTVIQPGGAQAVFTRNFAVTDLTQPTAFNPAPGVNAKLTMPDTTHYSLSFNKTKVVDRFTLPAAGAATAWLSSVADANGNTITYTVTGSPLTTTKITDTTGQRSVALTYTGGKVTGMSESLVSGPPRSWSYSYDSSGRLSTFVDAAGKTTRYCYSGTSNLLTKLISPHGSATGATCSTTTGTDVTDIAYDGGGHVSSISYENGASGAITVTFGTHTVLTTSAPGVTRETDPYGQHTDYSYDTRDRVITTVDPLGNTRTATFNTNNDVTAAVTPNNYTGSGSDPATTASYDPNNNLTKVTLPTGAAVSATYAGPQTYLPNTVTDDLGTGPSHTATLAYNAPGQLTSMSKGAATVVIRHEGDPGVAHCGPAGTAAYPGAVCESRDADYASTLPAEHRTLYAYDSLGELVSVTPPQPDHGRSTPPAQSISYDGQSRPVSLTASDGDVTGYHYDALDRLVKIDVPGHGPAAFSYDEDGDLLSQTDYDASLVAQNWDTFTYDHLNRIATRQNWTNGTATLAWDGNSRLLTYNDPGGTVSYGYDAAGGLTSLTEPGGSCTGYSLTPSSRVPPAAGSGCTLFRLDKSGHRVETAHPGDVADQTYSYDTAGRTTKVTGYTVGDGPSATRTFDYAYSYSATGAPGGTDTNHITRRTDNTTGAYLAYTYTSETRLTSAVTKTSGGSTTASLTYCYDPNGNLTLTSTTIGASCPGTPAYTYDGANELLTSPPGTATYDLDGNETQANSTATGTNQSRTTTYTRGDQIRTFNIGGTGPLAQLHFGIDNTERLSGDISATDSQTFLTTPLGISATTRSHNGSPQTPKYFTRDPAGNLIGMRVGSTHYYFQTDNQQSVLRLLNATGGVQNTYSYEPYGVETATENTVQPFSYTSGYRDDFSGLTKLGARYYDPTQARFTQPDPITHPGDPNQASPYPYAADDPINNVDPTGKGFLDFVSNLLGAVGGAFSGGEFGYAVGVVLESALAISAPEFVIGAIALGATLGAAFGAAGAYVPDYVGG